MAAESLGVNLDNVESFHRELLADGQRLGNLITNTKRTEPISVRIRCFFKDASVRATLGGPLEGGSWSDAEDPYSKYQRDGWGRRCAYYIGQLSRGLEQSAKVLSDGSAQRNVHRLAEELSNLSQDCMAVSRRPEPLGELREEEDLASLMVTYLEPDLFASLLILSTRERELDDETKEMLLGVVEKWVTYYLQNGHGKRSNIADESTIWWGVAELIARKHEGFRVGRFVGISGACELVRSLLRGVPRRVIFPDYEAAKYEVTCEVHGETRTRLLTSKNLLSVWEELKDEGDKELNEVLCEAINEHLLMARDDERTKAHVYLLGLGLEVMSLYLGVFNRKVVRMS